MNQLSNEQNKNTYSQTRKPTSVMLIIGIIFIAANLRAPLTSVGPLVSLIRGDLHISNALAGMITTIPLFIFALVSPFAPSLGRKYGTRLVVFCSAIFLTIGIILRSLSGGIGLFVGTAILGLAISVCNVLIPSLIKQDFSKRIGIMMGVFSVSMNTFGAMASGISIPIATRLGWSGSLGIWASLSFITIILWIPQLKVRNQGVATVQKQVGKNINIWKSTLAWQDRKSVV